MRKQGTPVLRTIALVVISAWGMTSYAAGLGPIRVQSALGHPLNASVPVLGVATPELNTACVKARLELPDGAVLIPVQASITGGDASPSIKLVTRQPVNEPAMVLSLTVTCNGSIQRKYQLLLDPIINLPNLAQASQVERTLAGLPANANGAQAMLAPSNATPNLRATKRRAQRGKAGNANNTALLAVSEPAPPAHKALVTQLEPRKVTRNVLRLSSDDLDISNGAVLSSSLKLSDTLSESRDTGDAQKAAELKTAYARFALLVRGEDPLEVSTKQLQEAQNKLQEVEQNALQVREQAERQSGVDKAAVVSLQREAESKNSLLVFLSLLLASAVAAIAWLYLRLKQNRRAQEAAFWADSAEERAEEQSEWSNTSLVVDDPFSDTVIAPVQSAANKVAPSDWERGVPLDDTLAVDWAARQDTFGAPIRETLKAARARRQQELNQQDFSSTFSPKATLDVSAEDEVSVDSEVLPNVIHVPEPTSAPTLSSPSTPTATPTVIPAVLVKPVDQIAPSVASGPSIQAPLSYGAKLNENMGLAKVEEISDLMQEAEFWMLLNDSERAIEILEPYATVAKPVSPVPWIYLLDLYRVTGQQENYRTLAERIKSVFNANAPAWETAEMMAEADAAEPARSLRDYPHIVKNIEELWEGEEIVPYLESLLLDQRDGARAGFDLAVYREIVYLIGVARDPEIPKQREQLCFDEVQPRLISQTVSRPIVKAKKNKTPESIEAENHAFDKATSQQSTSRQASARPLALKEAAVAPPPPAASEEIVASVTAVPQDRIAPELELVQEPAIDLPQTELAQSSTAAPVVPLEATIVTPPSEVVKEAAPPAVDVDLDARSEAERTADMARKLDLVEAYQEIGENVGARVLLEEVIQGGTALQVEKAKAMLKRLLKEIDWQ